MESNVDVKVGLLRSWNAERGFGFIECPTTKLPLKRYFLHLSEILEGTNPPPVGGLVRFQEAPPRKEGQLPLAKKAWFFDAKDILAAASRPAGAL
jgi:cold shock CspA family protein